MDKYIIVISDGETAENIECNENDVVGIIQQFLNSEYLMVATIVKTITEEMYES